MSAILNQCCTSAVLLRRPNAVAGYVYATDLGAELAQAATLALRYPSAVLPEQWPTPVGADLRQGCAGGRREA